MGQGRPRSLKTIMDSWRPADKGTIEFLEKGLMERTPRKLFTGEFLMCRREGKVFPELSVDENLKMGAYTRRDKKG